MELSQHRNAVVLTLAIPRKNAAKHRVAVNRIQMLSLSELHMCVRNNRI